MTLGGGDTDGSDIVLRVVVVSKQPMPVLEVLRTNLPGCLPLAVPSVEDVAQELRPDAVVLLDLGDGDTGVTAARQLRMGGVGHGIVVVGTADTGGIPGVLGLEPPFRLGDLTDALQRAHLQQRRLRVVVVSRQPLQVLDVLRTRLPGCLPIAVPTVDDVAEQLRDGAVVLLDLGEDDEGAQAARDLRVRGVEHGIVVVGKTPVEDLAAVIVLQPPFRLGELASAFQKVRQDEDGEEPLEQPALFDLPGPEAPPVRPTAEAPRAIAGPPPPPSTSPSADAGAEVAEAPVSPVEPAASSEPADAPASVGTDGAPPPSPGDATQAPLRRGPTRFVPDIARPATTSADPALLGGHRPSHPGAQPDAKQHGAGSSLKGAVGRWRQRKAGDGATGSQDPKQDELYGRLVQIFAATSQVQMLVDELPLVANRPALYRAIVTAVAEEFDAETVGLCRRGENGWIIVAEHGLTQREVRFPAGLDQPLLQDISDNTGAILLDPAPNFQGLLRDIAGAHTDSFMTASITAGSASLGVVTVGRDRPLREQDLDRLVEMAVEAGVGIGVADHILQMSELIDRRGGGTGSDELRRRQWREALMDDVAEAWHASSDHHVEADGGGGEAGGEGARVSFLSPQPSAEEGPAGQGPESPQDDEPESVIELSDRLESRR